MYPMPGWQVVLGEILAPAAILSVVQWLLVVFGAGSILVAHGLGDGALPLAIALSAVFLLPVLDALLLLIPNAAVLIFPSWMQPGKDGARGIEATGQKLILMFGQLVVFSITLIPAAAVFLVLFFVGRLVLNLAVVVPVASFAAALVLLVEVALGVMFLGKVFEGFDLSAELNP